MAVSNCDSKIWELYRTCKVFVIIISYFLTNDVKNREFELNGALSDICRSSESRRETCSRRLPTLKITSQREGGLDWRLELDSRIAH